MDRWFASDNNAGVHPEVMRALAEANSGHCPAYGATAGEQADPYCVEAEEVFRRHFGEDAEVHFVYNGTAANVLALRAVTDSWHAVIAADIAHVCNRECGAPENFSGTKLLLVPSPDGKMTPEGIDRHVVWIGNQHCVQPRAVSLTQATECGTVYTPDEVKGVAAFAHERGMVVHMDGARLSNAAASLGVSLRAITRDAGVDVLSFGGTKNGAMFGDAVVFLKPGLAPDFKYIRKQGMQLHSKMRFIAAQLTALLSADLWLRNARRSNAMAALLLGRVAGVPGVEITQKREANAVFAKLPADRIPELQRRVPFNCWNESTGEVRWMASFDTTEEDIEAFARAIEETLA
ncbi:MAG: threonine aldolase family protein [Planctomycetota bacterium]|jgi:threonine aldolase